jgi:DNA-binding PadR family transcriptional regulator
MPAPEPLTRVVFHVLLALADGPRHGYAIMKDVESHTEGALTLGAGTLYGTLQRLTEAGCVVDTEAPVPAASLRDERRRFYRLTPDGRQALGAEVSRLEELVRLARRSRGVPKPVRR